MTLLEATIAAVGQLDGQAMRAAEERQSRLTKPPGSLGRLEELSIWLAGVRGVPVPRLERPAIVVAAADHGVAAAGVSAYPREVTRQMVLNFLAGGAAINVLARTTGARLTVVDAGVVEPLPAHPELIALRGGPGTEDISRGPAMALETAVRLIEGGIQLARALIAEGVDALALGEMGIGNTTPSAAIVAAVTGLPVVSVTGRGTGLTDEQLAHKVAVVERALTVNRPDPRDGLALLSAIGGFEHAVLAGVVLGAASARLPVVLDGFITAAAALAACALCPAAGAFLVASHRSVEPGHTAALEALGLAPLLDLRLRLGEGSGAALSLPLLRAAAAILGGMATFEQAGVATSETANRGETA